MFRLGFLKNMNRNTILVCVAIVGILITGGLIFANNNKNLSVKDWSFGLFGKSPKQIGQVAVDYINNKGLSASKVSLKDASEESGLIKIKIDVGGQDYDSYVTKDGKFLFATPPIVMTETKAAAQNSNQPTEEQKKQAAASIQKTDKPMLEAYVVSRCPFGLQMQRAMAEAVKEQPSLAQYMKVIYMGSVSGNKITAMHGEAEATENLRQICIREEQPNKYWNYVACQMKSAGQEVACEKSTGVDSATLSACISSPSRGIAYAQKDFDLNTKYSVTGSPTLVLGGAVVDETNFGGRSADGVKSLVCAGFNTEAGFCATKLNTAEAASSFSADYASAGSGTSGAGCEVAQ